MKLEIIKTNNLPQPFKLDVKNKTNIIKAYECVKIRDYPDDVRNTNSLSFLSWALNMLGVNSKEGSLEHHTAVFEYINYRMLHYTYEELKEMVIMFISGDFASSDILQAQQLNALILGKIAKAYDLRKQEDLKYYLDSKSKLKEKESMSKSVISDKEKLIIERKAVILQLDFFIENRFIDLKRLFVYDILDKNGLMPKDKEYKVKIYKDALFILKSEYEKKKAISVDDKKRIKKVLFEINQSNSSKVKVKCKELVLSEFFRNITKDKDKLKIFRNNWI